MIEKSRSTVFILNCDWRNLFGTNLPELIDKLKRDQLEPEQHNFFIFSFARQSYRERAENLFSVHRRTRLDIFRPLLDLRAFFEVAMTAWLFRLRPRVWIAYDFGFLPALWLGRLLFGGKIILILTNQPVLYSRTRRFGQIKAAYSFLAERLFRFVPDIFMTLNQGMKQYLLNLNVPPAKIKIFVTDTIARDQALIDRAVPGRIRQKLGLGPEQKIILSIGRLEAEKDFARLLNLFAGLDRRFVLVILGQGSLLGELKAESARLGVGDRVFFDGFVGRDKIWDYYLDADVFALLSRAEALGMVFWEAMYLGVPVLGSPASGIVETMGRDGERGRILADSAAVADFVSLIDFCVTSSEAREEMIRRAREFVVGQQANSPTLSDFM